VVAEKVLQYKERKMTYSEYKETVPYNDRHKFYTTENLGGTLEQLKVDNPSNIRTGDESVRLTQDYKKCMKTPEELEELR
jgi:N-acetylmuramoyl-L-alanine amidase CwlA